MNMSGIKSFIFGKGTDTPTYEDVKAKRALQERLAERLGGASPRNFAEGISAVGSAIASRKAGNAASVGEEAGRADAEQQFGALQSLFGGRLSGSTASTMGAPQPPMPADNSVDMGSASGSPGAGLGYGDTQAVAANLIGGFEGFRETPYWDVNALRTGFGSDTVTMSDGSVVPVTEGSRVNREDATRDLQRRVGSEFLPRAQQQVGAAWDTLDTQQQAALGSIAYNYGSLPKSVAAAVQTPGTQDDVAAIRALGSHNDGINARRRNEEADLYAGGGMTGTVSTQGAPGQSMDGQDMAGLSQVAQFMDNPYASEGQKALAGLMMERMMQGSDPNYGVDLQIKQAQLAKLQNEQPEVADGFTLSPGQQRFDANGNSIAQGAAEEASRPMTPDERVQWGIPERDTTPYAMTPDGPKAIGGGGINQTVTLPGDAPEDDKLRGKLMEAEGTQWSNYLAAGVTASGMQQDLDVLDQVIEMAPTGPVTGRLAEMFPGVSDAGGVFQSVVKRVAPTLRVEGSGSQSDIEYNGMLQSLPALTNRPEANRAISAMMRAKAQVNAERGNVVQQYQNGKMDAVTARQALAEIDKRSIMTPELQGILSGVGDITAPTAPVTASTYQSKEAFMADPGVAKAAADADVTVDEMWEVLNGGQP